MRAVLLMGLVVVACSAGGGVARGPSDAGSGEASKADVRIQQDVGAPTGGGAVLDANPAPCSEPASQRPPGGTCIVEATGSITDLEGAPLGGLVMTFCGAECWGTKSRANGSYRIDVGTFLDTQNFAIHADGRPNHAVDYQRLRAGEPKVVTASMHLPTLPPSTVALPPDGGPATTITEGDLTLQIAAGTTFDLDIEDYGKPAGRIVRVAAVPLAQAPSYASAARVDAIYALAPSSATASIKMGVLLPNRASLPASAAVDLLVLGDDYFSTPPNVGLLQVAASAHVSPDGATITTDSGEGITKITWLAVRQKGK